MRMPLRRAFELLHQARTEEVVIATMGAAREWIEISEHPRDFIFVPSSMGQASSLGLGLALARPDLRVIVLNGDGSMLMNLGSLVTIAGQRPANLAMAVFDNGVYEITGGQRTAGSGTVDFCAVARAAGISRVLRCCEVPEWEASLGEFLSEPGPIFVSLDVEPIFGDEVAARAPCPMPDQIRKFINGIRQ